MLQKFAPLVKRQLEYWQRQIDQYGPDHPRYRPAKTERYRHLVDNFTELLDFLNQTEGTDLRVETARPIRPSPEASKHGRARQQSTPAPIPAPAPAPALAPAPAPQRLPDELSGLPPELLEQLSEGAKAQIDPIIKTINDRGGTSTLDQILIDLYRATGEVPKRTIIQNKIFRLSKREMCWSLPGKKGVYTTQKPDGASDEPVHQEQPKKDESPPAATDGPSKKDMGVAGLPGGPIKASEVGPTPTTSTVLHHRKLMSETSPSGHLLKHPVLPKYPRG
jgi:hypothetical protein